MLDDRSAFMYRFTYVNMCEELQGADRADIERLKGIVTSKEVHYRILGTHTLGIAKQNTTFFGTSNKSIFDSFRDTTGMRRFYEIRIDQPVVPEALAAVDIQAVWDGIDASVEAAHYLAPHKITLEEKQAQDKYLSNFQEWAQELGIKSGTIYMAGQALYDHYKIHCTNTMTQPLVRQSFYRELKSAGFQRTTYGNATVFLIDEMTAAQTNLKHGVKRFNQLGDA
jgi:predicted P-loop ATPase